eukprot:TRINITY_DN37176_c0_g1_i1.p2 TRINITY_DN37176_c0_g1~~TRINITY_DN37176_c0_g1_i1.p2  ORF type:complete len:210 (+),score=66.59 TRINITY_DN37176_c0_g1_i1:44-631(+)
MADATPDAAEVFLDVIRPLAGRPAGRLVRAAEDQLRGAGRTVAAADWRHSIRPKVRKVRQRGNKLWSKGRQDRFRAQHKVLWSLEEVPWSAAQLLQGLWQEYAAATLVVDSARSAAMATTRLEFTGAPVAVVSALVPDIVGTAGVCVRDGAEAWHVAVPPPAGQPRAAVVRVPKKSSSISVRLGDWWAVIDGSRR